MKTITILVPKGAILGSIEGPRQLFTQVNQFFRSQNAEAPFHVELVGIDSETPVSGGLYTIHSNRLLHEVDKTDLVVIPAIDGDISKAIEANKTFIPWIEQQYKAGAEVASLC